MFLLIIKLKLSIYVIVYHLRWTVWILNSIKSINPKSPLFVLLLWYIVYFHVISCTIRICYQLHNSELSFLLYTVKCWKMSLSLTWTTMVASQLTFHFCSYPPSYVTSTSALVLLILTRQPEILCFQIDVKGKMLHVPSLICIKDFPEWNSESWTWSWINLLGLL